jgi:hypothetical protein
MSDSRRSFIGRYTFSVIEHVRRVWGEESRAILSVQELWKGQRALILQSSNIGIRYFLVGEHESCLKSKV